MEVVDYLVVGAGSSGSVVAARLSEERENRVLVLEAGPWDRFLRLKVPIAGMTMSHHPQTSWQYESEPEPGLGGRRLQIPRGRVVGGSSAVNGAVYNRGSPDDFSLWAEQGLPDWSYASVLPYFRRVEDHWRGSDDYHGAGGPVPVTRLSYRSSLTGAALATARSLGYPVSDDWVGPEPEGWGLPDVNVDRRGRRITSATAFLKPALKRRSNIKLRPNATMLNLIVEGGRAVGARYEADGQVHRVRVEKEIVLSGGAMGSPQILLLSGIGPADELRALGIDVVHDLPGVGRGFNDQPMIGQTRFTRRPVTTEGVLRLDRLALEMARWFLGGSSVLSGPPAIAAANIRTVQGRRAPDLRFMIASGSHESHPWFPVVRPGAGHQIFAMCALAHPRSRGAITLRSADPKAPPRVSYNLLTDPWDVEEARRGFRLLEEFLDHPPLGDELGSRILPGRQLIEDDEIDAYIRQAAHTTAHPMGSCRMGVDSDAVVDTQCRVRGMEGLRVVDVSVLPVQLSGNPHGTAVMLGDRIGDAMLGRPALPPSPAVQQM